MRKRTRYHNSPKDGPCRIVKPGTKASSKPPHSLLDPAYPANYTKELRRTIRARDRKRCQLCGKGSTYLQVHHINYVKDDCREVNLITLCPSCHSKTNRNRNYWKLRLTRLMAAESPLLYVPLK